MNIKRLNTRVLASFVSSAVGSNKLILAAVMKGTNINNKRLKIEFNTNKLFLAA